MGRLLKTIKYLCISGIMFFVLNTGQNVSCQPVEEPAVNWAEWNVSVGYLTEVDIWQTSIIEDIYYHYILTQNDGIKYSVAKPLGKFFTAGIEMTDLRLKGSRNTGSNVLGIWLWPETYSTIIQNFNLTLRIHPLSQWILHPYLEINPGILRIVSRVYYPSLYYPGNFDLSGQLYSEKKIRPSLKEIHTGIGGGITWNAGPMLSFDIGIEINTVPADYLHAIPPLGFGLDVDYSGKNISYGRLVVAITSHSDITKLFRRRENPYFNGRYDPDNYLPFYKKRKGQ